MIKAVTGTKDVLPSEIKNWYYVESLVKEIFTNFNYREIRTPIFEETSLFGRGIGEETDIVSKEMYTFVDRGNTSLTLKPEMTAAVVRAFIEHSLGAQQSINKLFYISQMFRQERPQAGRLRQFHQFGAEAIGSVSPFIDAEIIVIAYDILSKLGLKDLTVKINSLGTPAIREKYKTELKNYLSDKSDLLSQESKVRLEKNILRLFDSKSENDIAVMSNAPLLIDYLDEESLLHFNSVKVALVENSVPFEVDPKLVRGLDYYTHTAFEIISGKVGSQSALCGGGRYDNLIEELGGKPTPGVGFAAGIERILLAMENENVITKNYDAIDFYLIRIESDLESKAFELATLLRRNNYLVEMDYSNRSVKAQMREANRLNAKFTLWVGGDEYKDDSVMVKNMSGGEQSKISLKNFSSEIKKILEK